MGVREWIAAHLDELDFDIVRSGAAFPDMTLRDIDGNEVETEIEFASANFIRHKHDPRGCQLVICWKHNSILPIPIIELSTGIEYEPNQEPSDGDIQMKFDSGEALVPDVLATLSGVPHLVVEFFNLMEKDLKVRSEYSKKMGETRLPLLRIIGEIENHLLSNGLLVEGLSPDSLFKLLS